MKYGILTASVAWLAPQLWLSKNAEGEFDRLRRAILGDGHTSACFDQTVIIARHKVGVCDGRHREM